MSPDWRAEFGRAAQRDSGLVVLEGFHAVKHAVRFGAEIRHVVTPDAAAVGRLVDELAPDLADFVEANVVTIAPELFRQLIPRPPGSPLLAIAAIPEPPIDTGRGTTVVLYEPRHAGNVGAAIRVAAAAGAQAVVTVGDLDPWAPAVLRAAAGLHYALDVHRADWPLPFDVPIVAYDADGTEATPALPGDDVAYLFGSERHGLPGHVLAAATEVRRIPMRAGVSSLNLATSVAVALYSRPSGRM